MGGDGGTIGIDRRFLKGDKRTDGNNGKQDGMTNAEVAFQQYAVCAFSGLPLKEPIVCCELGYLYNKEEILKGLLATGTLEEPFSHVRLKELIECKFTPNTNSNDSQSKETISSNYNGDSQTSGKALFMCPVSLLEANGKYPFCVLHPSGQVVSQRALEQVTDMTKDKRVIPLYPSESVRKETLKNLLEKRKSTRKESKKSKKHTLKDENKDHESSSKKKKTKQHSSTPSVSPYLSTIVNQVATAANDQVTKAKNTKSSGYASIFSDNNTRESTEKLFIGGNTRGYERC